MSDQAGAEDPVDDKAVSVAHARRLIEVYGSTPKRERPWYFEWAQTIDRLASALEAAGVHPDTVEVIGRG